MRLTSCGPTWACWRSPRSAPPISPKPGVGQTPESERYVEFVSGGKVVGREVAIVVPQAEVADVVKGPRPAAGGSRVDMLKGNDYVRVWINRSGMNYLVHLPPAKG